MSKSETGRSPIVVLAPALAALLLAAPAGAQSSAVSGSATALQATVGAQTTTLGATGSLADDADMREAALPTGSIVSVGGANLLHATTISGLNDWSAGERIASEASVADLSVGVAGVALSASFVMAKAEAPIGAPSTGRTILDGLAVNGVSIAPTGAENQTVSLPGLTLVINEVQRVGTRLTVRALHVTSSDGLVDLTVASATAGIDQ
jgi:hypothetical protein